MRVNDKGACATISLLLIKLLSGHMVFPVNRLHFDNRMISDLLMAINGRGVSVASNGEVSEECHPSKQELK